ncbi:hypothetical protein BU23DRAFT_55465 [Bimuria novae-zelandiae CBS 107.79]|uniref:Nucleoporin Nup133/Nup155-like C-terminal domain-containing protein n=1 Tax=Bimuria novae-zelandiae CBS 107.79 TaxID=1447943 RepID=A0A6A5VFG0_9PLEO|nr:hypothetical protein BU23DRAFT_55465 [Bimuria novae-zelandiae CBS 107.79]
MFSPEASTLSVRSSQRNSRRRPRNSTEPQQQQARRKRSKLGDENFVSVGDDIVEDNGNGSIGMNGHAGNGSAEWSLVLVDMPVRDKKGPSKRVFHEDIALYLNKNEHYSVKKLPNFPPALANGSTPFRASALPAAGLALALTSDQAFVWTYAGATSVSKVVSLPLPPALKSADPLPLGEVVRNGPTNDFGVVAVAPSTGRIVFWENIDSAEARSLFAQRKQGIEGTLKLYSGERVTQLVNVDHAGYILILSSGRLAQLTLRDAQGRPSISTSILNSPNGSSGSFFSIRGLLGSAIRKTIASVKARPSASRGQMEVITATRNGLFQFWDLSWSGQQIFKHEIDAKETILSTIQNGSLPEIRGQQDMHLLDFAISNHSQDPNVTDLLVLVALSGRNMFDHFLLEVDVTEEGPTISRVIPLHSYRVADLPKEATGTLLLPDPGHTALIQFPDAILIASLARPEESPETQLFLDSGTTLLPFQDCIYFKSDAHVQTVGHALEPCGRKNQTCSALFFIQDFGILQINAYAPRTAGERDDRSKVTAWSKLMQATFFSTVPGTILDFATKGRYSFSQEEVENAALDISAGVMSSAFELLGGNSIFLEDHLAKRALALKTLNSHLRNQFQDLSFLGRWQLLWHAEKLAAATKLWGWYQGQLRRREKRPELYPESNSLIDMVKSLHEKYKVTKDPSESELDQIRRFFIKDPDSIEALVPWAWNHFRLWYIAPGTTKSLRAIMQRLQEANEIMLTVLETGFSFRMEHVNEYGLDAEALDVDGVLKPGHGYDKLPSSFWTSTHNLVTSLRSLVNASRSYANNCYEKHKEESAAQDIAQYNPGLVRLSCANHIERFRWGLDQSDGQKRAMGQKLREEWSTNVRPTQIFNLSNIGLATEGMNLAERYHDMSTLANLLWEETVWLEDAKTEEHSKMIETEINLKLGRIKDRVADSLKRHGNDFANAYFSKYIVTENSGQLLKKAQEEGDQDFQQLLTTFLSADASRARMGWINNIRGGEQYGEAAADALDAAQIESNIWCETVELSIAKLSAMAQLEADAEESESGQSGTKELETIGSQLEVARIQNRLYNYLLPIISTAMDDESAVELLMTEYGQGRLVDRPALQHLLRQGFDQLVQHRTMDPYLLIDVLTLMTPSASEDLTKPKAFHQFALALKVFALSKIEHPPVVKGLASLIWKRVLLEDDWAEVNSTQNLSGEAITEYLGHTIAGSTVKQLSAWAYNDKEGTFDTVQPPRVRNMFGSGCTDGEYAVRFPEEDLRLPMIQDNLSDEAMVKDLVDNHHLEDWFDAAMLAGSALAQNEHENPAPKPQQARWEPIVEDADVHMYPNPASEHVEPTAGAFEQVDEDVEMQGS